MRDEYLPWWLAYYDRGDAWGFSAAIERETGRSSAGSTSGRTTRIVPTSRSWGTACAATRGVADTRPKGVAPSSTRRFRELGASRVYATAMAANLASWRVMDKAGMRHVRMCDGDWRVRIDGDEQGDVEYAITREEWLADQAGAAGA